MTTLGEIYAWFMTAKRPTQAQFWASWGSFWHKLEQIPLSAIANLTAILNSKAEKTQFDAHKTDETAHADLFIGKEDKSEKGAVNGYVPLNEFQKIASQYLTVVNDVITGGTTAILSAEQGKVLQSRIDSINFILNSDNINLDTIQELVDAIETVQTSLNTILVNDLTTGGTTKALTAEMGKLLQTNKVDKVAGERLINAAEITKLSGLANVTTTIKTILSTALATQNVAGLVTYINALNPVLVVGANEIVKYTTSDTGRTFELNLRGRSFGVGQPAIVAANVNEVTEFLNKDIRLSNYPSTRNDGQLPTNKVLSVDVNGKVGVYAIATQSPPYIAELIPDSYLPSTTGNIRIVGDFFIPSMCDRTSNPNAIILDGIVTIHYATFINSQEILVNVTTGSIEGSFGITLNNGLITTKSNVLLLVLGTVYKPIQSDWINVVEPIDIVDDGEVKVSQYNILGSAVLDKAKISIKPTINFRFLFNHENTPFEQNPQLADNSTKVTFYRVSDDIPVYQIRLYLSGGLIGGNINHYGAVGFLSEPNLTVTASADLSGVAGPKNWHREFRLQRVDGIVSLFYGGSVRFTPGYSETTEMYVKFETKRINFLNIKHIETV